MLHISSVYDLKDRLLAGDMLSGHDELLYQLVMQTS